MARRANIPDYSKIEERIIAYHYGGTVTGRISSHEPEYRFLQQQPKRRKDSMSKETIHTVGVIFAKSGRSDFHAPWNTNHRLQFGSNQTVYHYKTTIPNIKEGDVVVVDSHGWCFALVVEVWRNTKLDTATKNIVDVVGIEAYEKQKNAENKRLVLIDRREKIIEKLQAIEAEWKMHNTQQYEHLRSVDSNAPYLLDALASINNDLEK